MNRFPVRYLSRFLFPAALFLGVVCQSAEERRPNVLFILCDDIRWNAMSCAGHPALKTPNIDRIAHEGVRFSNMFCSI